tara:strand:- start:169 stop:348 length:180 start_codon:yes stop_codon:yes gene_type:complete
MIPIIGGAVGFVIDTMAVIGYAGVMGTGYAFGRKYGRKVCEYADTIETKIVDAMGHSSE